MARCVACGGFDVPGTPPPKLAYLLRPCARALAITALASAFELGYRWCLRAEGITERERKMKVDRELQTNRTWY